MTMHTVINAYMMGTAAGVIDGTQGSVNAGILAAVYFTDNGTTITVVGQKNVASVTRLATGIYRVTFTSALASANYGVLAGGRLADRSSRNTPNLQPSRNAPSSRGNYSTASIDITSDTDNSRQNVASGCVVVFDPASVGSDYLAAAMWTVAGTTLTLQGDTNVSGMTRHSAGTFRVDFDSALANANYQEFGTSRYTDFSNDTVPFMGQNRNTTGPINLHSTTQLDLAGGVYVDNGSYETSHGSILVKAPAVAPRGTLGSVRFTVSGGVVTIVDQWNIASVTREGTGLYTVNFTTPLIDTEYAAIGMSKMVDAANTRACRVGLNSDSTTGYNLKSTTQASITMVAPGTLLDMEAVNLWVMKPWLM